LGAISGKSGVFDVLLELGVEAFEVVLEEDRVELGVKEVLFSRFAKEVEHFFEVGFSVDIGGLLLFLFGFLSLCCGLFLFGFIGKILFFWLIFLNIFLILFPTIFI
jgi:hypothetical protein